MPNDWGDHGRVAGYVLAGVWDYVLERQQALADQPDPRVFLVEPGPARDRLIEQDQLLSLTKPGYRRGKASGVDIGRLEASLPVLILRRSVDCRRWPEAKQWPEIRDRSVDWFELHSDDRLIPVHGDVDPARYWD